ncbi:hypothetical protein [Roseimaritima sediminicola]|nr:hypothetical protein [Roseimaritima sediminicola]
MTTELLEGYTQRIDTLPRVTRLRLPSRRKEAGRRVTKTAT